VVSRKANGTDILSGCQGLLLSYGSIFNVTLVEKPLKNIHNIIETEHNKSINWMKIFINKIQPIR